MTDLSTIKNRLNNLSSHIASDYLAEVIGIFGSVAEGDESDDSDIDLLVSFEEEATLFHYIDLADFLEGELGRDVDIVTERSVREELQKPIYDQLVRL